MEVKMPIGMSTAEAPPAILKEGGDIASMLAQQHNKTPKQHGKGGKQREQWPCLRCNDRGRAPPTFVALGEKRQSTSIAYMLAQQGNKRHISRA
eukprot:scaffold230212_cov17-Tisochrysis_lutea.AAC.1